MGVSGAVMSLAAPVGLILSGLFADRIGVSAWFVISGILTLSCAVPYLAVPAIRNVDKPPSEGKPV